MCVCVCVCVCTTGIPGQPTRRPGHTPSASGIPEDSTQTTTPATAAAGDGAGAGAAGDDAHGGADGAAGGSWVASLSLDELSVLHSDAGIVAKYIRDVFLPAFVALLGSGVGGEVVGAVRQGLEDAASQIEQQVRTCTHTHTHTHTYTHDGRVLRVLVLHAHVSTARGYQKSVYMRVCGQVCMCVCVCVCVQGGHVLSLMSDEVTEACVTLVRQLKGITATYRITTKGPPTRHSHYVLSVLTPLKSLLEGARVAKLTVASQQRLAEAVADNVTTRYQVRYGS